ncbi:toluene-4-monooxygenase system B family protein [Mycobacterium sp. SM1]|uniref:toluene-4-monooxygenase system B family protein n=1 Tax=Mycobacterium sp. SM1 TaxID=2816243 RepID=UPI001BD0A331|nr:toluene-4-monooxygenase system B family protein [Mycobacterium sp. SM1]MBS4730350.1 toluene-4-monooxygenase system B family protein [Mycobacterium sp. SM1]
MALLPIQGWFRGDFAPLLVPVDDQDTVAQAAEKVAYHVVGRRLPARQQAKTVLFKGKVLDPDTTLAAAGVGPMDVVDVMWADEVDRWDVQRA